MLAAPCKLVKTVGERYSALILPIGQSIQNWYKTV